jgi:uncharacterized protein YeaO (DUF488 family)
VRQAYQRSHDRETFAAAYTKQLATQDDLLVAYTQELSAQQNVCLLCLEAEPGECHRSILAEELGRRLGVEARHL